MANNLAGGQILEFRVWTNEAEQAAVNTYHYKVVTVTGTVTDVDAAIDFDAVMAPLYKPLMQNLSNYRGTQARIISLVPLPIAVTTSLNAGVGTAGATGLPRQCAGLISWQTALAGPGHRGRTYLPFPSSFSDTGDGQPGLTYQNDLENLANALEGFGPITSGGGGSADVQLVLKVKAPVSPIPITDHVIRDHWATQRRRGSFGRANVSPV